MNKEEIKRVFTLFWVEVTKGTTLPGVVNFHSSNYELGIVNNPTVEPYFEILHEDFKELFLLLNRITEHPIGEIEKVFTVQMKSAEVDVSKNLFFTFHFLNA
jgi:hypothetical protein